MQKIFLLCLLAALATSFTLKKQSETKEWISLFDGKSLNNWKASENPATFSVADGMIVVHGPRAHLFYEGPVANHDFKNFELQVKLMTTPGSHSCIFFHTAYQENISRLKTTTGKWWIIRNRMASEKRKAVHKNV